MQRIDEKCKQGAKQLFKIKNYCIHKAEGKGISGCKFDENKMAIDKLLNGFLPGHIQTAV